MHVMRLWKRVIDSTRDLGMRRQGDDRRPPSTASRCARSTSRRRSRTSMINVLAPVVQEIARRSGAPGELVLRRDLGEGRREEIYITKAELQREGDDAAA